MTTHEILGLIGIFLVLAVLSRKAFRTAVVPNIFTEEPEMRGGLSETIVQLNKWREEKRLTMEEYERLMKLCQEDAEKMKKERLAREKK